ncbi:dopamine D2-like receptor isoform X2 [Ostrea edulis]|uniref:dopamine D2-like receptor isoform X2 n=1 Tax=Ostrea edulis TaxID=37623 RepID=UPI0024AF3586|nr:dopamine D2-like receptor isoform X2 [Ostrea edulis]
MSLNVTEVWTNSSPGFNVHVFCDSAVHDHFPSPFTVFIIVWLSLILVADLVGNTLVILVILKNPSMRDATQTTNFFLLNLAIADLLVCLVIPFSIHSLYKECWDMPLLLCKINSFLVTLSLLTSIHTLMYISIHKFISVRRVAVNNDFNDPVTRRTCFTMIGLAWVYAIVFSVVTVISDPIFKEKTLQCGPKYPIPGEMSFYLHIANQIGNLFVPIAILMFCYIRIFVYIRHHAQVQRRMSLSDSNTNQGERGVTLTLFIVLACFLLCWLPYMVYTNYAAFVLDKQNDIPFYLNPLAYCFGYMNSACNPLIYAWRIPRFRQGYTDIIKKTRYIVTIDTRSPRTPEDSGEKLTMLSVNGQRSEVKKPRPQTERLTSIEEKQGEGAARL